MDNFDSARALIAIDAVVFDTETTGLDPATARIVEMGGVRIAAGRMEEREIFRQLVNPGAAIPAAASAIHGIADADVAEAPRFGEALASLLSFAGERIWIGHSIGFDFAILKKEAARAGLAFAQKPALDTRLLAQIVAPQLPGFSMETLCAWLNVEPAPRHSALGDAQTAARIFLALVPHLRERGIRTIGEALRASSRLTQALEAEHAAGWAAIGDPLAPTQASSRIDAYPYRHRAADIMSCPPRFASPFEPAETALAIMMREKISSLFIRGAKGEEKAQSCGIITERDLLRAVAYGGASALARPLEAIASRPVHKVAKDSFLHVAMARMTHLRIRHLAVTDSDDRIVGALSARDLLRLRADDALSLGDSIELATDARGLAAAWSGLSRTCAALVAEGLNGLEIASVISHEICAMTARAVAIAQDEMQRAGAGEAPCPFAFLVLGSAARGESLLAMDQDNALVFADGDDNPPSHDAWFAELAARISDLLHEAGVPLCKGAIMARNPLWRGSLKTWHSRIETWVTRSDPADLLSVDVFFDMRFVAGDASLAESLRMNAMALTQGRHSFAKLLVESSGAAEPAFNLFGRLRLKEGRIDLKRAGLFRLVCAVRALAIKHGIGARATAERLSALRAMNAGGDHDLEYLIEAQRFFLTHILRQQIHDIGLGAPPSNRIEPARLSGLERERLRESLHAIEALETLVRDLLFSD